MENKSNTIFNIKIKDGDEIFASNNNYSTENINIIERENSIDVIKRSDIIIVTTSNVGIEACALDKPLIVIYFEGLESNIFKLYQRFNCALFANDEQSVNTALNKLKNKKVIKDLGKGRKLFIEEVLNGSKKGTIKNISNILEKNIDK